MFGNNSDADPLAMRQPSSKFMPLVIPVRCWGGGLTLQPEDVLAHRPSRDPDAEYTDQERAKEYHRQYMRQYRKRLSGGSGQPRRYVHHAVAA